MSERERELIDKLEGIDAKLLDVGQEYGVRSIATAHVRKIGQIEAIDERISELAMTLAAREASGASGDLNTGDAEIKRLIVLDHATADMLFERTKRAARLAVLKSQHAPEHFEIVEVEEALRVIDEAIEDRRKQLTTLGATGALTKAGESADSESLQGLRALKQRLESRQDGLRDEAKLLNSRLQRSLRKGQPRRVGPNAAIRCGAPAGFRPAKHQHCPSRLSRNGLGDRSPHSPVESTPGDESHSLDRRW